MADGSESGSGLANVRQAIEILMHLGKARSPQHLRALADHLSTSKSTVQRILASLEVTQMVRYDKESESYQLGPGIIALHADYTASQDALQEVHALMDGLRQKTGETVMLSLMYGVERLVILRVESHHSLRYVRPVGGNYPLHCGATGKALLAALRDDELDELLPRLPMTPLGPNANTDRSVLRREISLVRERGYAISREESVVGVAGLAVAVDVAGMGMAGLGVYGPVQRFTDADIEQYLPALLDAAESIKRIR